MILAYTYAIENIGVTGQKRLIKFFSMENKEKIRHLTLVFLSFHLDCETNLLFTS